MKRVIILVMWALLVWAPSAAGQNTRAQESRKAQLMREMEILNKQIKENSAAGSKALSNLQLVRRQIDIRRQLIASADREISALDDSIKAVSSEIALLQARSDTLNTYYSRLVRSAYKNRDTRLWYMYILSSSSFGQAFRRVAYLRGLSRDMSEQAVKIRETEAKLTVQKDRLAGLRAESEALRQERIADLAAVKKEEASASAIVSQLQQQKKKYQAELSKKAKEVEALNREIQKIIADATKPAASSTKKGGKSGTKTVSSEIDTKLAGQFQSNKGKLPWPSDGTVVERFGQHPHPVFKNVQMPFNNGVTIAVKKDAPVKAVFNGKVARIVVMPGYNQCVLVQHGSYFTFYCKLKEVKVKAGDKVTTGQVLGTVDTIAGENQLHFQLWSGKDPQNPENWLK